MHKLVLVTGSAKIIGASILEIFARNGYDVIINYQTSELLAIDLKKKLNNYNINVYIEKFDVTNEQDVKNIFNKYNIDILVNNASVSLDNELENKTKDEFMKVMEVNLYGTFLMCQEFIKNNNTGVIINMSSTDAIDTYNILSIDYCASKAGIINMTKNLANNYPNIKVCAVCPNWIKSESVMEMDKEYLKNEMNRIGQKELIEASVVANKVYEIATSSNINSGEIVRIDYE